MGGVLELQQPLLLRRKALLEFQHLPPPSPRHSRHKNRRGLVGEDPSYECSVGSRCISAQTPYCTMLRPPANHCKRIEGVWWGRIRVTSAL